MLSFDITDRNIRVVKGIESNGKIKISSAATLNVEEELIINGHVKDVPNVATLINGVLKKNKMPDKEAIVSISSNLTIFKELEVPKVKLTEMQKTVKQKMQAELNLDDTYSVSYIIVGDGEGDTYKVLATACPYEIVNSYREVFKLLGISLRSVMIGCNCITKVLLADTKIQTKMPLLAVQIDNNFISLNLYEAGQLSFSRFASIDAADYGYSDDYVFEAVNENIFRMLQFHRSRNTGEVIENIIFYGDTHDYVRLTDELEKMDLQTSLINVPAQIHGHENLEFSLYANAIGAMFRRNKDTEKINLLETDLGTAVKNKVRNEGAGDIILLAALAASVLAVGGTWLGFNIKDNHLQDDIQECQEWIDSPDTKAKLAHLTKLETIQEKVNSYYDTVTNLHDAFYSQPVINGDKYLLLESTLKETAKKYHIENAKVRRPIYREGIMEFAVIADAQPMSSGEDTDNEEEAPVTTINSEDVSYALVQELPATYIQNLLANDEFEAGDYTGYKVITTVTEDDFGEEKEHREVQFNVALRLKGNKSAYKPEAESGSETESEENKAD